MGVDGLLMLNGEMGADGSTMLNGDRGGERRQEKGGCFFHNMGFCFLSNRLPGNTGFYIFSFFSLWGILLHII